ncbi:MAG: phosphatase PAP2 family protein [Candidatus Fimivivens sp.]
MAHLQAFDHNGLWLIYNTFQSDFFDWLMPIITILGDYGGIWVLSCFILLLRKKTRMAGITMALAMLACYLFGNLFLKNVICRARPYTDDPTIQLLIPKSSELYSFPSGHAMCSFAAAATLALWRDRFASAAIALAILIAFSRIYLMMHYPLDVGAGMILGICSALIAYRIVKFYAQHQRSPIKTTQS